MMLLSPLRIGPMEVKNRVVSAAHAAYRFLAGAVENGCDGVELHGTHGCALTSGVSISIS